MTETITLELGKFYRTRDGFQCGPMGPVIRPDLLSGYIKGTGVRVFKIDGGAHAYGESALDLVGEWADEPGASVPEQSEAEAIADERWDANDLEGARAAVFNFDFDRDTVTAIDGAASDAYATGQGWLYTDVNGTRQIDPPNDFDTSKMTVKVSYANEYRTEFTETPPVLSVRDGHLIISLTNGPLTLEASVGDGRYFFSQVIEHLINPALLARQTTHAFASKWMREHGIGSPND